MLLARQLMSELLAAQFALEVLILTVDEHLVSALARNKVMPFLHGVIHVHMLLNVALIRVRLATENTHNRKQSRMNALKM